MTINYWLDKRASIGLKLYLFIRNIIITTTILILSYFTIALMGGLCIISGAEFLNHHTFAHNLGKQIFLSNAIFDNLEKSVLLIVFALPIMIIEAIRDVNAKN